MIIGFLIHKLIVLSCVQSKAFQLKPDNLNYQLRSYKLIMIIKNVQKKRRPVFLAIFLQLFQKAQNFPLHNERYVLQNSLAHSIRYTDRLLLLDTCITLNLHS